MHHLNITNSDATSGVYISDEFTFTSAGKVTLSIWGDKLSTLDIELQLSPGTDGAVADIWVPVRSVPIGLVENIFFDEDVKIRVVVSRFGTEDGQSINISTGGGNAV